MLAALRVLVGVRALEFLTKSGLQSCIGCARLVRLFGMSRNCGQGLRGMKNSIYAAVDYWVLQTDGHRHRSTHQQNQRQQDHRHSRFLA